MSKKLIIDHRNKCGVRGGVIKGVGREESKGEKGRESEGEMLHVMLNAV